MTFVRLSFYARLNFTNEYFCELYNIKYLLCTLIEIINWPSENKIIELENNLSM